MHSIHEHWVCRLVSFVHGLQDYDHLRNLIFLNSKQIKFQHQQKVITQNFLGTKKNALNITCSPTMPSVGIKLI